MCGLCGFFFKGPGTCAFIFHEIYFFIFKKRFGQLIVGQFLPSRVCERSFHFSPGAFPGWWDVIGFTCLVVMGGREGWLVCCCSVRLLWKGRNFPVKFTFTHTHRQKRERRTTTCLKNIRGKLLSGRGNRRSSCRDGHPIHRQIVQPDQKAASLPSPPTYYKVFSH